MTLENPAGKIEIPVCGGTEKTVFAVPKKVSASLFEGETEKIKTVISKPPFLFAPVEKGDIVGKALFYLGDMLVAETPLLAENNVETISENKGFWNNIKEIF